VAYFVKLCFVTKINTASVKDKLIKITVQNLVCKKYNNKFAYPITAKAVVGANVYKSIPVAV
jgi:hypothetical protein